MGVQGFWHPIVGAAMSDSESNSEPSSPSSVELIACEEGPSSYRRDSNAACRKRKRGKKQRGQWMCRTLGRKHQNRSKSFQVAKAFPPHIHVQDRSSWRPQMVHSVFHAIEVAVLCREWRKAANLITAIWYSVYAENQTFTRKILNKGKNAMVRHLTRLAVEVAPHLRKGDGFVKDFLDGTMLCRAFAQSWQNTMVFRMETLGRFCFAGDWRNAVALLDIGRKGLMEMALDVDLLTRARGSVRYSAWLHRIRELQESLESRRRPFNPPGLSPINFRHYRAVTRECTVSRHSKVALLELEDVLAEHPTPKLFYMLCHMYACKGSLKDIKKLVKKMKRRLPRDADVLALSLSCRIVFLKEQAQKLLPGYLELIKSNPCCGYAVRRTINLMKQLRGSWQAQVVGLEALLYHIDVCHPTANFPATGLEAWSFLGDTLVHLLDTCLQGTAAQSAQMFDILETRKRNWGKHYFRVRKYSFECPEEFDAAKFEPLVAHMARVSLFFVENRQFYKKAREFLSGGAWEDQLEDMGSVLERIDGLKSRRAAEASTSTSCQSV